MKASFVGRWRITEMELWDQEFIDLESPGHITFERGGRGELHFGAVNVTLTGERMPRKTGWTSLLKVLTRAMKSLAEVGLS
jgi:hypothetical protein